VEFQISGGKVEIGIVVKLQNQLDKISLPRRATGSGAGPSRWTVVRFHSE
jgi:hypothetical protein